MRMLKLRFLNYRHKKEIIYIILIFLIASVFYFPGIKGQILWGQDTAKITFPFSYLLDESIKNLNLRMWTPDIFFGFPLGSEQGQYGIFYPLNLLHAILPLQYALSFLAILHISFAGVFTYVFARKIKVSPTASLIAAISYMFNGSIIAHAQYPSHIYAYTYLPLVLLTIELALQKKSRFYFVLSGCLLGVQALTGHPNIPVMTFLAAVIYIFFKFFNKKREMILGLFYTILFFLIISSPYLVQLNKLIPITTRAGGVDFLDATNSSYSIFDLITFIYPNFFFQDISSTWNYSSTWHSYGYWGQIETAAYMGITTLFLSLFAIKKKGRFYPFLAILVVGFIVALGRNTPIYKLIIFNLPLLNSLRAPGKFMLLVCFSLAILASFGFDNLIKMKRGMDRKIMLYTVLIPLPIILFFIASLLYPQKISLFLANLYPKKGLYWDLTTFPDAITYSLKTHLIKPTLIISLNALLLLFVRKYKKSQVPKILLLFLLVVDLFLFTKGVNAWKEKEELMHGNDPVISQLKSDIDYKAGRVYTFSNFWSNLMPNQLVPHHIPEANGFTSMSLKRYDTWQKTAETFWKSNDETLFDLGSISYIYERDGGRGQFTRLTNPLPRAFTTGSWYVTRSASESLNQVASRGFINKYVVIEGNNTISSHSGIEEKFIPAEIKIYEPHYVKIEANSKKDSLLVLTDTNFPGWEAFVNGEKTKIYQANYLFRGVFIPGGISEVEFIYKPKYLLFYTISMGTLLGILIISIKKV